MGGGEGGIVPCPPRGAAPGVGGGAGGGGGGVCVCVCVCVCGGVGGGRSVIPFLLAGAVKQSHSRGI